MEDTVEDAPHNVGEAKPIEAEALVQYDQKITEARVS